MSLKNILTIIFIITISIKSYSQAPAGINYQAIVRDSDGNIRANQGVGFIFSIETAIGSTVYTESHTTVTNEYGLVNLVIGRGTTTQFFSSINWANTIYFLNVKIDGTSIGSTQFMSVPYALFALKSGSGGGGVGIQTTIDNGNGTFTLVYTDGTTFTTINLTGPRGANGTNGINGTDGINGESAYEIWLNQGNTGTKIDFLRSLNGTKGNDGLDGSNGESAYETWLANGNTGSKNNFLISLIGDTGPIGPEGPIGPSGGDSAYDVWLKNGNDGSVDEYLLSLIGASGPDGINGVDGKSAYEIWVNAGNAGTISEYLLSLVGPQGPQGEDASTTITGGASTIAVDNLAASKALQSNVNGKVVVSSITAEELGFLTGLDTKIQDQLDGKQPLNPRLTEIAAMVPTDRKVIVGDGTNFTLETIAEVSNLGTISTQDADAVNIDGGTIDGTTIGGNSAATGSFTQLNATQLTLQNNESISNATNGTVLINGIVAAGTGNSSGIYSSNGDQDLTLQTGNSSTGNITIIDGADGNISISPNGTGQVVIDDLTFPADDGTNKQVLSTNGAGNLAWTNVATDIDGLADGKSEGADFTGSLLLGHETTGSLNAATGNTGVGIKTLDALTRGDNNTASGYSALTGNTYGSGNTASGSNALFSNSSGNNNTASGYNALFSNTGGENNTATGKSALSSNSSGDNNTAVGNSALKINNVGAGNTALGYQAGDGITGGSNNVIIGLDADPNTNNASNQIVIGKGATGQGDNYAVIGNSDITRIYAAQDASATLYAAGINLENNETITNSLDGAVIINGVVVAGEGSTDGIFRSNGDQDLTLKTGNSTTGSISIKNGTNGNIALSPNGTGEVDISKVDIDDGAIDGTTIGSSTASTGAFTTVTASTSIDITGAAGLILEKDETITNATDGTVLINGTIAGGSGLGVGIFQSNGDQDVTLQTGNSTTGSITITDGANGNITLSPNGTGEVDISKVDIDGGTIDGTVIGASSASTGAFTTVTANTAEINTSIDITGPSGLILSNDETITNATDGTVVIDGEIAIGSGSAAGVLKSSGNQDITLKTGNSTTGTITITDGGDGNIYITPNGTGRVVIDGLSYPSSDGSADHILKTDGLGGLSWTTAGTFSTVTATSSIDITGTTGLILENDETITNATDGTVLINGIVAAGTGSAAGVFTSNGSQDITIQTGNSTTGSISITDGPDGNIAITPNGTGELDISKVDIDGGTIDGTAIGANATSTGAFTTVAASTSVDISGAAGLILQNDETITNATDGTVLINSDVAAGTGSAAGVFKSSGNQDITLQTGNSSTGTITITDGANGNIAITPNGTGEVDISKVDIDAGTIDGTAIGSSITSTGAFTELSVGSGSSAGVIKSNGDYDLTLQTGNSSTGTITITDGANGNIAITPNGTGEVDISKVDIDGGAIDGATIGANSASTGAFTTVAASTSVDISGAAGLTLQNDETITNATDGTVLINGTVASGTGSNVGVFQSNGDYDLTLQTGNSTTGTITITDGTNGNIAITPNGTGEIDLTTSGALDMNAAAITIDASSGVSIDASDDSNVTVTGSAKDLTLAVAGGGTQELNIQSAGTGSSAVDINASAGGVSIDAGAASNLTTSAGALTLDGAAGINVAGNSSEIDVTTSGTVDLNSGTLDLDATNVTIDATSGISLDAGAASNITTSAGALTLQGASGVNITGDLKLGGTLVTSTPEELNILDASASNSVASDVANSAGAVTSNNYKISHTLTLDGNLANDAEHADITITNNKVLVTSVVMASVNKNVTIDIHTVVLGSFKVRITNKSGSTLSDNSTIIINYIVL
jgi:hypothetical protein